MVIGIGGAKDTSRAIALSDKFMLIIGRDNLASSAWTTVGCWQYTVYFMKTEGVAMYFRLDDVIGPLMESGVPALYVYARSWTN